MTKNILQDENFLLWAGFSEIGFNFNVNLKVTCIWTFPS